MSKAEELISELVESKPFRGTGKVIALLKSRVLGSVISTLVRKHGAFASQKSGGLYPAKFIKETGRFAGSTGVWGKPSVVFSTKAGDRLVVTLPEWYVGAFPRFEDKGAFVTVKFAGKDRDYPIADTPRAMDELLRMLTRSMKVKPFAWPTVGSRK